MKKEQRRVAMRTSLISAIVLAGLLFMPSRLVMASNDTAASQGIVDRARVTFSEFMRTPDYVWLQENVDQARGILIFPQVLKGGFIFGAPEEPVSLWSRMRKQASGVSLPFTP